jgi:hypothetical protein
MGHSGSEYSGTFRRARICGFQPFLRGFRLATLARLGVAFFVDGDMRSELRSARSRRFAVSASLYCSSAALPIE